MAFEKVKIFSSLSEGLKIIPKGEKRLVKIGESRICLVNKDNHFFAFSNECPHLGHSLHEGSLNFLNEIVCPWHSYRFSILTGEECEKRSRGLTFYEIVEEDGVFVLLK